MKKKALLNATIIVAILFSMSIMPVVQPPFTGAAPPPPASPTATLPPTEPDADQPPHIPPGPGVFPPEVEQAHAQQAIEAVLEKHLAYWGPRYQVAPIQVTVEGEWAHGIAEWQSDAKTLSGPIHILAHRLTDGTWQALMPNSEGLYLAWVNAIPESLVSTDEMPQLRAQAVEADTWKQPQAMPEVQPTATLTPPAKKQSEGAGEPIPRSPDPTPTPTLVVSQQGYLPPVPSYIQTESSPRLVFVRQGDIWIADSDGRNQRQLTFSGFDSAPVLSPDGLSVVYLSIPSDRIGGAPTLHEIWSTRIDSGERIKLTSTAGALSRPIWSPDGTRIAYFENGHLIVINPDGSGKRVLADSATFDGMWQPTPVWSPDGTSIACMLRSADDVAIWLIDVNSATSQRITDGLVSVGSAYAFQPASNTLSFLNTDENRSIWLIDLYRRQSERLDGSVEEVYDFAWSSDGRKLVYSTLDSSLWLFDTTLQTSRRIRAFDPSWALEVESVSSGQDSVVLLTGPVSFPEYVIISLSTGELIMESAQRGAR